LELIGSLSARLRLGLVGKAKHSNILVLVAFTEIKFICLAKSFIAPAIYLIINQYLQATAHCSAIIYL
jgi:hypothetical protein